MSNMCWRLRPLSLALGIWTVGLLAGGTGRAEAALRPVAVLSIASVDTLIDEITYFAGLAGQSGVGGFVELAASGFLQEIDCAKPLGVLILVDHDEPWGVGFLPVRNFDQLLQTARDKLAIGFDSLPSGIHKMEVGPGVYLKQHAGWLYFSDHPRHLAELPDDPVALCGGLDQQYSIALRLFVQHIPAALRDAALTQLHAQIDAGVRTAKFEDPDLDRPFLESAAQGLKRTISALVTQSDQLTAGWAVDTAHRRVYVDLQATALDGSELAAALDQLPCASCTLRDAAVPNAALTCHAGIQLPPQVRGALQTLAAFLRTKALRRLAEDPSAPPQLAEVVRTVLEVVDRTATEAVAEAAASVVVASQTFRAIGAVRVADGPALATALQQLYSVARQQPDVPAAAFFTSKIAEVDLHRFTVKVGRHDVDARKIFGSKLEILLGTGPRQLYLAFGRQCDELLRQAVEPDAPAATVDENQLLAARMALRPLLAYLTNLEPDRDELRPAFEALAAARGGDGIGLTVTAIPRGLQARIEVEEGVLEMVATAATHEKKLSRQ